MKILLEGRATKQININRRNCYGVTLNHYTLQKHNLVTFKLLASYDANMSVKDVHNLVSKWYAYIDKGICDNPTLSGAIEIIDSIIALNTKN